MNEELLQIKRCQDAGYHPQIYFEGWRVAYLNDTPKFQLKTWRICRDTIPLMKYLCC